MHLMNTMTCKRCIMNTTVPDIEFDETGVCNYCKKQDEMEKRFPQGKEGLTNFEKIFDDIKARGKGKEYDCIVGVSGGVDSTYTLYQTVKMGLRPLAVLFDNGWCSEIAVSNIKNAIDKLGVDLETYVVDWEEFKAILISFLNASVPDADIPTDIGIKSTLYRIANKNKIKYIITGGNFRTEGQMPRKWSYMDGRYIRSVYKMFSSQKLKCFPNLTMADYFNYIFIKRIKVIRILNYLEYNKSQIKKIITEELNWRDYGGKHYESIYTRFNQTKMRYFKFGIDPRLVEYSALVRSGQISRDLALETVQQPPIDNTQLERDVEYVIKKLGLSNKEFDEFFTLPAKTFEEYPTYYPFIMSVKPIIDFISKFIHRA